jgi:hypothetical protein
MQDYRKPFLDPVSREPVYRFPNGRPIAGAGRCLGYGRGLLRLAVSEQILELSPLC